MSRPLLVWNPTPHQKHYSPPCAPVVEPPPPRESIQAEGGEGKEIGLFEAMEKQRRYQQTTERGIDDVMDKRYCNAK